MAEGTRIRGLDERLGTKELKLGEISEELTKTKGEHNQKFVEMDIRMERIEVRMAKVDTIPGELKQFILNLNTTSRSAADASNTTNALITGESSSLTPPSRSENPSPTTEQVSYSNINPTLHFTTVPLDTPM